MDVNRRGDFTGEDEDWLAFEVVRSVGNDSARDSASQASEPASQPDDNQLPPLSSTHRTSTSSSTFFQNTTASSLAKEHYNGLAQKRNSESFSSPCIHLRYFECDRRGQCLTLSRYVQHPLSCHLQDAELIATCRRKAKVVRLYSCLIYDYDTLMRY